MTIRPNKPQLILPRKTLVHPVTGLEQEWAIGKTGKPKLVLSGSMQNSEASCSNFFAFNRFYQNPRRLSGHAADCGTALHDAYQDYLMYEDFEKATWVLMNAYPWHSDHQKNATYRQFEECYATLAAMCSFKEWPSDWARSELLYIKKKDETIIPAVETMFEIYVKQDILEEFDVYIAGALDCVMLSQGGIDRTPYVFDIKTTREKILWDEKFKFANQGLPYHILLSHILGEDVKEFTVMYLMAYIHLTDPVVKAIPYTKKQTDIDEYLKSFVLLLHKLSAQTKMGHWPKNSNSCTSYNRPCQYIQTCAMSRDDSAHIQEVILGEAEPYDRYATTERMPDFELEMTI